MEILEKFSNYLLENKMSSTFVLASSVVAIITVKIFKDWLDLKSFFKKMGIPAPTPLPLIGNMMGLIKNSLIFNDVILINKYGKIMGVFEGSKPIILTTDVKFLKCLLIKDFSSFVNRRVFDGFLVEPIDKFLTIIKDDEWKNVRSLVSTTFTTGKLKNMSKCMKDCLKNYESYLKDLTEKKDGILATKIFYMSYTIDVISSCCFGMDTNSINDPNNEFILNIQKIFSATTTFSPKFILLSRYRGKYTQKKVNFHTKRRE